MHSPLGTGGSIHSPHGTAHAHPIDIVATAAMQGGGTIALPQGLRSARQSAASPMNMEASGMLTWRGEAPPQREDLQVGPQFENTANASTCASSLCESSFQGDLAQSSSRGESSRVLFAKASELIRVEIAASERRIAARFEQERTANEATSFALKGDMASMLSIVEALSSKPQMHQASTSRLEPMLEISWDQVIDTRIEEERRARDLESGRLLMKIDALASQVQCLPAAASLDQDRINVLLENERKARNSSVAALQKEFQALQDSVDSLPSAQFDGAACWNKFNVLLEHERLSRDTTCRQLRKDLDAVSSGSPQRSACPDSIDEGYLNVILEQERRKHDLTNATLRKDFFKELESLSKEVQSMKISTPNLNEERAKAKLQQDVRSLAEEARGLSLDDTTVLQPAVAMSPLEVRLESKTYLTFEAEAPPPPSAFSSVFASSA